MRRFIPSRAAISRCDTPSAANALTSAHSDTLRTLSAAPRSISINEHERRRGIGRHRSRWRTFHFLEVAQYWAPGVTEPLTPAGSHPT